MLKVETLNAYYGQSHVLKDVSIAVKTGQVVVILGPNGHGKSTLLKSICGLVDKASGHVVYKGHDIMGKATEKIVNMGLIYIAENRELFPYMTVLENLKLGAYSKNARSREKKNLERVFELFPRLVERQKQFASTMSGATQPAAGDFFHHQEDQPAGEDRSSGGAEYSSNRRAGGQDLCHGRRMHFL